MTHARRQPRGADPASDRLAEPRVLRRGRRSTRRWSASSTSATAAAAASACASRSRPCSTWSTRPPTARCDGVDKKDYAKVVEQCYLCDLCYMTKCPYVPPHPWNVDFPHLMLRAKAIALRQGRGRRRREAARRRPTCTASSPASRSSSQAVNAANRDASRCASCCEKTLGVASRRAGCRRSRAGDSAARRRAKGRATRRSSTASARPARSRSSRPAIVNYNEPGIGLDLVAVLEHNDDPVRGRREGELLRHAQARARRSRRRREATRRTNIPVLARYAREGYAILTRDPVVHADVQAGAAADVPRRRRRAGGAGGDVRSVRVPRSRATATAC